MTNEKQKISAIKNLADLCRDEKPQVTVSHDSFFIVLKAYDLALQEIEILKAQILNLEKNLKS